MPIPKPKQDENKDDFMSRCMSNETMQNEYEDNDQRYAVCQTQWDNRNQESNKQKSNQRSFSSLHHNMSELVEHRELEGQDFLVVPTVMIVEGVLNGLYYSANELADCPQQWNGRPVVVEHSVDAHGNPKSANDPEELEKRTVGYIYNTRYVEESGKAKLKAEAWINPEKCRQVDEGEDVLNKLENNQPIEVSTGLFTYDVYSPGKANGQKYNYLATDFRADHLALLPNGIGACSWDDGAGAPRINKGESNMGKDKDKKNNKLQSFIENIKQKTGKSNELGIRDLHSGLMTLLEEKYENRDMDKWVFIEDIFPTTNTVVFEISSNDGNTYYKQEYVQNSENGGLQLEGDPQEVEIRTDYVPKEQEQKSRSKNKQHSYKENKDMEKDKLVKYIIDNSDQYSDEDKDTLNELSEDMLNKMKSVVDKSLQDNSQPNEEKEEEEDPKNNDGENGGNKETADAVHFNSEEEFLKTLPDGEIKRNLEEAVKERQIGRASCRERV